MNATAQHPEIGACPPEPQISDDETARVVLFELERVLSSPAFRSSDRSRQFLTYVVQNTLAGNRDALKERSIGVDIYHRKTDYATGDDPVVRISAGEVRKRLEQYYVSAPANTSLRIEIPRGSYAAEFRWLSKAKLDEIVPSASVPSEAAPVDLDEGVVEKLSQSPELQQPVNERVVASGRGRSSSIAWAAAGLLMIALAGICVFLWLQVRAAHRSLSPWRSQPALHAFWSQFLDSSQDTDVVTEDSSYLLLQSISKQRFSLQDYLDQDYVNRLQLEGTSQELRMALSMIASKDLGRADDARLVQRIDTLDPLGTKFHTYSARAYTPEFASSHNMIILGGELSNPWAELFDNQMNFVSDSKGVNVMQTAITNRNPAPTERLSYLPVYTEKPTIEYCSVAYLPSANHVGKILLIEGTSWVATDAGVEFLLSENELSSFLQRMHTKQFPYFNILLKTTKVSNTPLGTTIEAYRTYPNLN